MRTLCFIALFCLFFPLLSAQADNGQAGKKVLSQTELQEIFTKIIRQNVPAQIEEIRIDDFASQPESLAVPPGAITSRLTNQFYSASPGKKFIAVTISVDGQECGTVKMYGNLHFWGTVVLAARPLSRNSVIDASDLATDFRDVSMLGTGLIERPELAIGKQLRQSLRAGDIMFTHQLKNKILVKRGDQVTILAKSGSLQVTAPGEVKSDGAAGDMVRVKNLMSRRILQAKVVEEGLVEVKL